MKSLLPFYERELGFVRSKSQEFARRFPKIAGGLGLSGDSAKDPHVERMIESFALLSARIHKRLDDDFPLLTESLIEVLYPHYLRPFPSCSVACFDSAGAGAQLSKAITVARHTTLSSRAVKGVVCKFRSTQDVTLLPVSVDSVAFRSAISAPDGTALPSGATSVLSITLALTNPQASWADVEKHGLRFYLDGESSVVSVLREALCRHVLDVMVQISPHHPWVSTSSTELDGATSLPRLVGFDDEQALIDFDSRSHVAYRLLTEYFAFPEKFNFVDVPVQLRHPMLVNGQSSADELAGSAVRQRLVLHLPMSGVRADSDDARLLEMINHCNMVLGCTPVVNLHTQSADPIRLNHAAVSYPVVVDSRKAFGYEVYSVDKVFRVKQTPQGEVVDTFKPFFSLQHEELVAGGERGGFSAQGIDRAESADLDAGRSGFGGRYWSVHRDDDVAELSPGYEYELSIVDLDFCPAEARTDTLSLTVTATNRDLPSHLVLGQDGGDLFPEGGGGGKAVRLLRKPSLSHRLDRTRGTLWRLVSHLSLNHLSLSGGGIDALKEMLRLYDLPRSASNRKQIDGLLSVEFKPATAWLPGVPFATFVRGTEVRLTIDEESFVGTGLALPAAVLDRFFGLYAHANSFTRLILVSARTKEEVLTCPPRNGDVTLV